MRRPRWLGIAVIVAVAVGIVIGWWLFDAVVGLAAG